MSAARSGRGTAPAIAQEVALVTGGARRIGRAIVERLAAEGYAVAIHCNRSRREAEKLAAAIRDRGGRAAVLAAELADVVAARGLIGAAKAALGPVTLLVNNASEFGAADFKHFDAAHFDRTFAVNLRAPLLLAHAMAAALPRRAVGAVVNVLDQEVLKLTPLFFSYTLSKAALAAATITMAQALAPRIRVNGVAPGPTLKGPGQSRTSFKQSTHAVPLRRASTPQDVAEAVLFLARAKSVTGAVLAVDAGQHIAWLTPDVMGFVE
jgi:NAD(P)-dependent dehydrogenase (short-subunit alcohol dehydrogenase family)